MNYLKNLNERSKQAWNNWPYKGITLAVLAIVAIALIVLALTKNTKETPEEEVVLPAVQIKSLQEIANGTTIDEVASIDAVSSAPLISRTGGRVTAVKSSLGSKVYAGQLILEIDGGSEANPGRVNAEGAAKALAVFNSIEKQGLAAAANAVEIAELNASAAGTNQTLSVDAQTKARALADNAVRQAEISRQQALDGNQDLLIRSANIALQNAELAQDQATISKLLTSDQTATAKSQAVIGLENAKVAQARTKAELESQRITLETQAKAAAEQVRLAQVTAPLTGSVASLNVRIGDFLRAGQTVGEVVAPGKSIATINVPDAAGAALYVGQTMRVSLDGEDVTASVKSVSSVASTATGLRQVDLVIDALVQPNAEAIVHVPVVIKAADAGVFLPLDAVNVREKGIAIFTIDEQNVIHEHMIVPNKYYQDYIETNLNLPADAKIVVKGNRALRDGDKVQIIESK